MNKFSDFNRIQGKPAHVYLSDFLGQLDKKELSIAEAQVKVAALKQTNRNLHLTLTALIKGV